MMKRVGQEFEEAVYTFAKALDPSAAVLFSHKVPDRDTGTLRQCDVWINARFGGHWPLSILVSCKDRSKSGRKLNIGHVGTFCNEVRSTGANMGVIYCNTGFTKPALEKARINRVPCCRLYRDEPADMPEAVWFDYYSTSLSFRLVLETEITDSTIKTWNNLFDYDVVMSDGTITTVLDRIVEALNEGQRWALDEIEQLGGFPPDWEAKLLFTPDDNSDKISILVQGQWKKYRSKLEATLLEGSYNFTAGSFMGSQEGPWVDTESAHPGSHWEEVKDEDLVLASNRVTIIRYGTDAAETKQTIREKMGQQPLKRS